MKLLLADDDIDQMELRSLTLTKGGFQTCIAGNAEVALRVAAEEKPQVAIVDLKLPTEQAGLRLIRDLKKFDPTMRVIVLTGADPKKLDNVSERGLVEAIFTKGGGASRQIVEHLKDSAGVGLRRKLLAEGQLVLEVKVIPRSSKSEIVEFAGDGSLKVKLAAVPEKGKANEELILLLADYFGVRKDAVELMTGETSQRKRIRIRA